MGEKEWEKQIIETIKSKISKEMEVLNITIEMKKVLITGIKGIIITNINGMDYPITFKFDINGKEVK